MKCERCGKWVGAHATLPGQPTDHLCHCGPLQHVRGEFRPYPPLDEERVRQIVREELERVGLLVRPACD